MIKSKLLNWEMSYESYARLACQTPCSMYSVLFQHGLIEDPFYRDNEYALTDYSRKDCEFETRFEITDQMLERKYLNMVFYGLDTVADIYVNDTKAYYADNMHYAHEVDLKPYVHAGANTLKIHIYSPVEYMETKQRRHFIMGQSDTMPGFPQIRKSSCMMGWDWAPKLPDMGIYRDVEIHAYDAKVSDIYVRQKHANGRVTLDIACEIQGAYQNCTVSIAAPDGAVKEYAAPDGKVQAAVENPMLWWPNGLGEQNLYSVSARIADEKGLAEAKTISIGLRTLTVSREKDCWGEEFCFVVNGIKVFSMGADYVPEDSIIANLTAERTEKLVKSCALANHNSIRVWGGAFYPHDYFYDMCDKYGLIVWQDFMFACERIRISPWFLETMKKEITYNVRRLRNRACLGLLCGNNEMEQEYAGAPRTHREKNDYVEFFEHFIPDICDEFAPDIFYWPSSPSTEGGFRDPTAENKGDQHYWGAWHERLPYESYREHFFRFCSEFGFESFPSLKTIDTYAAEQDKNPLSPVMEAHQKCTTGISKLLSYMADKYIYATNLKSFVYGSQILQADAIRCGVEHFRRYRGRCMGAVYWQLNDCWPVASWASLDYFGRWKALHYASKRFFAPVLMSLHENGTVVTINTSNETHNCFKGTVRYGIRNMKLNTLYQNTCGFEVDGFHTKDVVQEDFTEYVSGKECEVFLFCELYNESNELVSSCSVNFVTPKKLLMNKAHYVYKLSGAEGEFSLSISSDTYAKFVELDFKDVDVIFSDNFFDLIDAKEKRVTFTVEDKSITAQDLEAQLEIFSLCDME